MHIDIHLSAEAVDPATVTGLEGLAFKPDFFQNSKNNKPPHYHASFRTHLGTPDNALWQSAVSLLKSDPHFRGCLEEEINRDAFRYSLDTVSCPPGDMPEIRPFKLETCSRGQHKSCDIHINIDLGVSSDEGIERLEAFNFISFERVVAGITCRVYSLTFESLDRGKNVFEALHVLFKQIPGLKGKMKLEEVTRFMAYPEEAEQLPIVRDTFLESWLR